MSPFEETEQLTDIARRRRLNPEVVEAEKARVLRCRRLADAGTVDRHRIEREARGEPEL